MNDIIMNSIDEFNTVLFKYADAEVIQLDKGIFNADMKFKNINDVCILLNINTFKRLEAKGVNSKDYYTFHFHLKEDGSTLNNVKITTDTIFVIPPNQEFQLFSKNITNQYAIQIKKDIVENRFGILLYQTLEVKDNTYFRNLFNVINHVCDLDEIDDETEDFCLHYILRNIKYILFNNSHSKDNKRTILFANIVKFIELNYKENLTIEEIAFHFNISARTMRNIFFDVIGYSPKKYLIAYKLNMFKNAIKNNNKNLNISNLMINHNLHFQSQVNKDFKDFFNNTPFKYKKSY